LLTPELSSGAQLPLTRAELCSISDTVVVGEVTDVETHWASGSEGQIERLAHVAVLKNTAGAQMSDLTVTLPGGTIDALTHWVEDQPELLADHTYLLFLERFEQGWRIVGGERGAVRLQSSQHPGESLTRAVRTLKGCYDAK